MLTTMTTDAMLAYWKVQLGLASFPGANFSATADGTSLEAGLLADIERWYSSMLLTAPASLLPCGDAAATATVETLRPGIALVRMPRRMVRPIELKLSGWRFPVATFRHPEDPLIAAIKMTGIVPGTDAPAVEEIPQGLRVYGCGEDPEIEELYGVIAPAEGEYVLDTSLLPGPRECFEAVK